MCTPARRLRLRLRDLAASALDGQIPHQVYSDNLTTRRTTALSVIRQAHLPRIPQLM